jgi:DNA-binding beta-propeller fold protein YncE
MSNQVRNIWAQLAAAIGACCLLVVFAAPALAAPFHGGWENPHRHSLGAPHPGGDFGWLSPFSSASGSLGSALLGSAPVGNGPSLLAVDPATHTIYVANGDNDNGPSAGGNTVSVINALHCQAQDVSRCKGPWPTITVGNLPSGIAIDQKTDTVYVTNAGDNTVSVFNGATCNANDVSGCGQTPATVPVGLGPIDLFADPSNHTVYVADYGASVMGGPPGNSTTVSMINSATCNATDLSACPTTAPPTVDVGAAPNAVAVNLATHSAYVTVIGALDGWSVFDTNTCNATDQSGCGAIGYLAGDPIGPNDGEIDQANNTLYSANYDNTISAFDTSDCNASDLAGCAADTPGTVMPFPLGLNNEAALYVAVDVAVHSVYVSFQRDDALMVVDTNVCNGGNPAGCATLKPLAARTGAQPEGVVLDPQTQTLYTANETDNDVSVIDATRCNAQTTSGCRKAPPAAPIPAQGLAADPAVNTLYVTEPSASAISMLNTRSCNSFLPSGCAAAPARVTDAAVPVAAAVNPLTHTVYVANQGTGSTGTVSVVDADTCNATDSAGCGSSQTLQVLGGNPDDIEVDAATDTVYVATRTAAGSNVLSVFNAATCDASNTTGCSQTPATLSLGDSGGWLLQLAVDQATNTIYATNITTVGDSFVGSSVYVFNGASCDAGHKYGCSQAPAIISAGDPLTPGGVNPWGIAIDEATDTIYVALQANGDDAGSVAVINGAVCNGSDTAGCNQTPPKIAAGWGSGEVGIDPVSSTVYTTNTEDESLSVIHGTTCNRWVTFGCGVTPATVAAGSYPGFWPGTIAVDAAAGTIYVSNLAGGLSVIPLDG